MPTQYVFSTRLVEETQKQLASGFKVPRHMNPFWKGKIGIRKPGVAFSMKEDEMQEYVRCAGDIKYFAEKYCKIKLEDGTTGALKLRPYQNEVLDLIDNNRFSILMASRQVGKCITYDTKLNSNKGELSIGTLHNGGIIAKIRKRLYSILGYVRNM